MDLSSEPQIRSGRSGSGRGASFGGYKRITYFGGYKQIILRVIFPVCVVGV
jgi:hypothetical protein